MVLTQEQREWLSLTLVPGVGSAAFIRLLARFHTPGQVLQAPYEQLREMVGKELAQRIAQYTDVVDIEGQERAMARCGAKLITLEDPAYPLRLAEIYDPPLALFMRGDLRDEDAWCVCIVGTRQATPYGLHAAEKFGRELAARGITVVSGMAMGIDTAAHRGAISAGGRTIAILGCGVDVVYPSRNRELMEDIIRHGCVLSQFAMGMQPSKGHFPYRNRIISGMSMGTLVVEAPERSGALITAKQAAEQGREVFAVPGSIGSECSAGPHRLIQEGAKLVQCVDDILMDLELPGVHVAAVRLPEPTTSAEPAVRPALRITEPQPLTPPVMAPAAPPNPPALSPEEKGVLSVLASEGSYVDEIAMACRVSISEALSALTMLEMKGLVRQYSGKRFAPK